MIMDNQKWIKKQFEFFRKYGARYREALILTSFIETIVREKASKNGKHKDFKRSLETLGLVIDKKDERKSTCKTSCVYKNDCLVEVNLLRTKRNELLHDIIKKRLPQKYIDAIVRKMGENIRSVFIKSILVRCYFKDKYGVDPAEML